VFLPPGKEIGEVGSIFFASRHKVAGAEGGEGGEGGDGAGAGAGGEQG